MKTSLSIREGAEDFRVGGNAPTPQELLPDPVIV